MIKYLGSKRRLVEVIGEMFSASGAKTALDLFTGSTRVAVELKRRGGLVTAVDTARYSEVLAACSVATDRATVDPKELVEAIEHLSDLEGVHGYFTETFCVQSRYFQPHNGRRIDAIRDAIEKDFSGSYLWPLLMTSLMLAADRVDSTVGVQMAYVKSWSQRSYKPLQLKVPVLLDGQGRSLRADACKIAPSIGPFDFAYLDPPYNQHQYYGNYHVWETLVKWDDPEHYGVACKRVDVRDASNKSVFNSRRLMRGALRDVIASLDASVIVLSYNDEAWLDVSELVDICSERGSVRVLGFDSKRYVGAQIGICGPGGEVVGQVSRLRNVEYLVVSGERSAVERATAPFVGAVMEARSAEVSEPGKGLRLEH